MNVQVLYFAAFRERFGTSGETVGLSDGATAGQLVQLLRDRGEPYVTALSSQKKWRIAVNHDMANEDAALKADDEVALFPPVTGG